MAVDLLGNTIAEKGRRQNPKGSIVKTVNFSRIICQDMTVMSFDGNKQVSLDTAIKNAFSKTSSNHKVENGESYFDFTIDNQIYVLFPISHVEGKEFFGRISTEKEHKDILEIYKVKEKQKESVFETIIIDSFTFFYINIAKKSLTYIGHKNIQNLNKVLQEVFDKYGQCQLEVRTYVQNNLLERIKKHNKLNSITARVVPDEEIKKSLNQTMRWDMSISSYSLQLTVKGISNTQVETLMQQKGKTKTIQNPQLLFQDQNHKDVIINLFEDTLAVKESIQLTDPKDYSGIKAKLIDADKKYINVL